MGRVSMLFYKQYSFDTLTFYNPLSGRQLLAVVRHYCTDAILFRHGDDVLLLLFDTRRRLRPVVVVSLRRERECVYMFVCMLVCMFVCVCVCPRVTVTPRVPLNAKREYFFVFFLSIYGHENRIKIIIIMKKQ